MSLADITPTPDEIAALERTRTAGSYGGEMGQFQDSPPTRPTLSQVTELINDAVSDVALESGTPPDATGDKAWPEALYRGLKNLARYKTAMLIELSYFSEQVGTENSPYDRWERLYDKQLAIVERVLASFAQGDEPGPEDSVETDSGGPIFNFGNLPTLYGPVTQRVPGGYWIMNTDNSKTFVPYW